MAEDTEAERAYENRSNQLRDLIQEFFRATAVDEYDQGLVSRFILVHESIGVHDGRAVLGIIKDPETPIWTAYGMLFQANSMLQDAYNEIDEDGPPDA